jgi:hypothetical protein
LISWLISQDTLSPLFSSPRGQKCLSAEGEAKRRKKKRDLAMEEVPCQAEGFKHSWDFIEDMYWNMA